MATITTDELKQKLKEKLSEPVNMDMSTYVKWERERDAILDEIKDKLRNMNEKDFRDKDGWWYYVQSQRDKQIDKANAVGERVKEKWWDDDNKMWKTHGKPLQYYAYEYRADYEISCAYCDKPLAYWHGSPDLSATDVVCFECYRERTQQQATDGLRQTKS